jgi:hypothetical protein
LKKEAVAPAAPKKEEAAAPAKKAPAAPAKAEVKKALGQVRSHHHKHHRK